MTDNEIVKALECCLNDSCYTSECFFFKETKDGEHCQTVAIKYALDLINRQKAKNEALQMDNAQLHSDIINANMNLEHVTAEIERLKEQLNSKYKWENMLDKKIKEVKAEAIKEFAERLKTQKTTAISCDLFEEVVRKSDIDNLVKEMVGDTDEISFNQHSAEMV